MKVNSFQDREYVISGQVINQVQAKYLFDQEFLNILLPRIWPRILAKNWANMTQHQKLGQEFGQEFWSRIAKNLASF